MNEMYVSNNVTLLATSIFKVLKGLLAAVLSALQINFRNPQPGDLHPPFARFRDCFRSACYDTTKCDALSVNPFCLSLYHSASQVIVYNTPPSP